MTCSCSLVPNSIKQSISHPVYNLKMVVKVTRDDQQSHYTRFGVTLNWQCTYKRERKRLQPYGSSTLLWTSSRLRWRIWQWKWRNSSTSLFRLREEVFNTTSVRHEEMATNEETIKDVQEAQSNLTWTIQILTDFYVKNFSATIAWFGEPKLTTEIRWEVPMSLAPYK